MNLTSFFGLLGGLLVLAFVANKLAKRTKVPDVLVLMATGMILGPVFHWVDPANFEAVAHGFGTLALILILFEAGLDLDIRTSARHFPGGIVLAILSFGLNLAGGALFLMHAIHVDRISALLVAAAFACVSGSVMLPVLQQMELRNAIKTTLVVEASLSDAFGVLGVGILLDLASASQAPSTKGSIPDVLIHLGLLKGTGPSIAGAVLGGLVLKIFISLAIAFLAGFLWAKALPLLSEQRFWQVLTFAAVLLVYASTHAAGGTDLFAVIAFGATLANLPGETRKKFESSWWRAPQPSDPREQLLVFHSELAFLVRTFFFVLLGLIVRFSGLRRAALPSLGVLGVLFVARWIAVQLSRFALRGIDVRERELATLLIPRGLITAVLAFEIMDARAQQFGSLPALVFAVILLSNLLMLVATFRSAATAPAPTAETEPEVVHQSNPT